MSGPAPHDRYRTIPGCSRGGDACPRTGDSPITGQTPWGSAPNPGALRRGTQDGCVPVPSGEQRSEALAAGGQNHRRPNRGTDTVFVTPTYYRCGPIPFVQAIRNALLERASRPRTFNTRFGPDLRQAELTSWTFGKRRGRCSPTCNIPSAGARRSTSHLRERSGACGPTTCSGWPPSWRDRPWAPVISLRVGVGPEPYGVVTSCALNVNGGVPKTLIQLLIRWVSGIHDSATRTTRFCGRSSMRRSPRIDPGYGHMTRSDLSGWHSAECRAGRRRAETPG